jgi:hypothetical protein
MENSEQTTADAPTIVPADTDNEAEYLAAVKEGKAIVASISGKQWALGDLAARVEKSYGGHRLEQFAEDIDFDGEVSTLSRCRSVCLAFPKTGVRPRFFASAQILQTHPDRFAIVERNPDISKAEARALMREALIALSAKPSAVGNTPAGALGVIQPIPQPVIQRPKKSKTTTRRTRTKQPKWATDPKAWADDRVHWFNNACENFTDPLDEIIETATAEELDRLREIWEPETPLKAMRKTKAKIAALSKRLRK